MKYYKLIIKVYSIFHNDYITKVKCIQTDDIYHYIGWLYCNTLEDIKRVDYQDITFDYYSKFKEYYYYNGHKIINI